MGQKLLKMGDLTKACGVSDQAVRLYERMGLLKPVGKTSKGYRIYDTGSVDTLRFIKQAQRSGFNLEEIRALLHTDIQDDQACASMKGLLDQKIHALTERLVELQATKDVLQSLRKACEGEPGPLCPAFLRLCVPNCTVSNPQGVRSSGPIHEEERHDD
ncbi:MerR family DNA-binding protein [Geothrix sp.]|uniref:MerR family DNA-binding protein n=1 Tax=Geothrix sp. TaxID=1962974 RepID=UPI0025BDBE84|nr:MerR family DNA-binding protein [Geothrix sp.]